MTTVDDRAGRFMQLYAAHQRQIFAFIRSLVFTHQDAEDLTQDTVAILWRKFDGFEEGTSFIAWATSVARYEVLNRARRKSVVSAFDPELVAQIADEAAALAELADVRRHALHECIQKLPGDHRELLRLHYDAAEPVRDIAEQTGRSERTVYRMLQQVHQALFHCIRRSLAS